MLEDVRKDLVANFLLRKSALTEAQLDTILASEREGNLNFKSTLREKGKVSKGAFARTLKQGEENIRSSVYTLFLLAYLDLLPPERLDQLSRTTRMLAQLKSARAEPDDMLKVIEAMEDFVQGFARKKRKVIL
jgi:hypothetical protein